jgi:hypothetical protein
MLRFEDKDTQAGSGKRVGRGKASHARTDDEDVMGVGGHASFYVTLSGGRRDVAGSMR